FFAPDPADRLAFADGDFTQQFWVFRDLVYRQLAQGRLPLWADCLLSGYPLHADPQTGFFYLPSWITYGALRLLGYAHYPVEALALETIAHYLFVSLTLYLFLRAELSIPAISNAKHLREASTLRVRSSTSALMGAVVFTYSGYLTGTPPLQTATLQTLAWLPLTLLCLRKLTQTRSLRYLAFASGAFALAFLGGHPQTFVYVGGVSIAYLLYRARAEKQSWRIIARWILGWAALAAALAAVQILPTLQFIAGSTRASIPFDEASRGFPIQDIVQFFFTGLVSYWQPLYLGLLPLAFAAFAGLTDSRAGPKFWAGMALAGLILSFGALAAAYDLGFWLVPLFKLFRGQERFSLVAIFSLSVLCAYGADLILSPLSRKLRRALIVLRRSSVLLFVLSVVFLVLVFLLDKGDHLASRFGIATLFSMLAAVALHVRIEWPAARRGWPAIFLLVVALDLFTANRGLNASRSFEAYGYDPLLDPILADSGFFRVQDDVQLKGHAACGYGFKQLESITPYKSAVYEEFLARAPEKVRWQLLGVKYVVTWRQALYTWEGEEAAAELVAERPSPPDVPNRAGITKAYRLKIEPRRAFLVHEVRAVQTADDIYAGLAAPGFDPYVTAYVQDALNLPVAETASPTEVRVIEDQPGAITIHIRATSPGLLIVGEAYDSGWQAAVNGRGAQVIQADGALIGVPVPAGESQIALIYRPTGMVIGAGLTALALLIAGIITF
ncbi:MAG TPA: YfhO family protein, partial [Anaerolineales bacterium]|nr:YfhO family protein [Anaerolineales bacterium]